MEFSFYAFNDIRRRMVIDDSRFNELISDVHKKREKAKAFELKKSQWWRQQIGPGLCYYCKNKFKPSALTMDHVIPISRGGKSSKKNCVPACKTCNNEKKYKTTFDMTLEKMSQDQSED